MKKITMTLFMLLTVVSAVSLSGCLGYSNPANTLVVGDNNSTDGNTSNNIYASPVAGYPGNGMWMERNEAEIRDLDLFVSNGNVIARITTQLGRNESLDLRGIKVIQFGNTINIYVPSVEPTTSQGKQIVDVKIGTVKKFSNGNNYAVSVNNGNDKKDEVFFRFESGTFTVFKPAHIRSVTVNTDGNTVVAVAEIMVPDKTNYSVDGKNVTFQQMHDREFDVYIPVKISGASQLKHSESTRQKVLYIPIKISSTSQTNTLKPIYHEVVIGNLSQFPNGRYEIDLNDFEVSFMIQNGQLALADAAADL